MFYITTYKPMFNDYILYLFCKYKNKNKSKQGFFVIKNMLLCSFIMCYGHFFILK